MLIWVSVDRTGDFMRVYLIVLMTISALQPMLAFPVSAISPELAKKCRALAIKAHPPQTAGTKPYATAERELFNRCVLQNGEMSNKNQSKGSPQGNE